MNWQEFSKLDVGQKYDLINQATIRAMQDLGGQASRRQIIERIRNYDPVVSQEIVDHERKARKTRNYYSEFKVKFGFSFSDNVSQGWFIPAGHHGYRLHKKLLNLNPNDSDFQKKIKKLYQTPPKKSATTEDKESDQASIKQTTVDNEEEPKWRTELRQCLFKLDPHKFELLCRKLLNNMNVDIDENIGIKYSNDGGVDGFGYLVSDELRTERIAIQAKRWGSGHLVSSPEIDKFRGAMDKFNAEYGVFITTSDFTRDAIKNSRSGTRMITLINGEKLLDLIVKYKVYVHREIVIEDFYKD